MHSRYWIECRDLCGRGSDGADEQKLVPVGRACALLGAKDVGEFAAPQLAVETFPSWLGALGPLLASPVTAAVSRAPWGKPRHPA